MSTRSKADRVAHTPLSADPINGSDLDGTTGYGITCAGGRIQFGSFTTTMSCGKADGNVLAQLMGYAQNNAQSAWRSVFQCETRDQAAAPFKIPYMVADPCSDMANASVRCTVGLTPNRSKSKVGSARRIGWLAKKAECIAAQTLREDARRSRR